MQRTFDKLEQLLDRKDEIENELHQLTGYYFPKSSDLFNLVMFNLIELADFEKAFKLMTEKAQIEKELKQ